MDPSLKPCKAAFLAHFGGVSKWFAKTLMERS
ncbi:hypothetical protein ABENE_13870 [Asticcacaulis benevestitus DSM 16100 = ATCC BAA-896]|uniref:Uncharacterized protein n=1 Tax=Asticcacaulis benevestitus DSM 16100 = ATCC BAA-896 TaxID=1121022 RepID=V4P670_9CAUL|nr:hypothetical protein ABENE_13870 [Asticcacaulis benevestitus DSM 16100 = ATCC BAA-896]